MNRRTACLNVHNNKYNLEPCDVQQRGFRLMPPIYIEQLEELNLVCPKRVEVLWPRTRDTDIPVLRDRETGVCFLSEQPDLNTHYAEKTIGKKKQAEVQTRTGLIELKRNDDLQRRLDQTQQLATGKAVCDFGTGMGHYLTEVRHFASSLTGVEIRQDYIEIINERLGSQVEMVRDLSESKYQFDFVTLFHVLEHIPDQLAVLSSIFAKLKPGGQVFIEVPHARDYLSDKLAHPEYRDFIYWSEHLVLHTRQSITAFLKQSGFDEIRVSGFQRYGYANHLYWLRHEKPGGHEHFAHMSCPEFDAHYAAFLGQQDATDTLIATAKKFQ